ncbi:MAG: hypothetical protein QOG17_440, partial [Gammaproteobacteria bacterium]|nr:hypothetical protein [Gammaproteobacteria bacterium]
GSWIRTNDLQYPKLPRYQAALYPECPASPVDTRFPARQQDGNSPAARLRLQPYLLPNNG